MPKFQRVRQNPPRSAKFRRMVHCVCCANSTDNPKFARVSKGSRKVGRVARRPLQSGVEVVKDLSTIPRRSKSLPEVRLKNPKVNPMDQEPSDAMHLIQLNSQRGSSSLDVIPARVGEEWWEILFKDIGIISLLPPPDLDDHTYAMGPIQDESSLSS